MLGAAASSSAEPFWFCLCNKPPRSQSAAAPRLLEAARDLRGKNRRHENYCVWVLFWIAIMKEFKKEGKKNLEQLRKTPQWMRRQPPESLCNIWPTETKVSSAGTPGLSPDTPVHTQTKKTFHLCHPFLVDLPPDERHVRRNHCSVNGNTGYIFNLWEFFP